jgi:putative oxidoreductase
MSSTTAATAASQSSAGQSRSRRRGRSVLLWGLQVLLAVAFAAGGLLKLGGAHQMVELFAKIGAGQWFRYVIGIFEVAGAVGMLVPVLSGAAALGLTGLMAGATITNLAIGESPWVPIAFLLMSAVVARGRWPQAKALPGRFLH